MSTSGYAQHLKFQCRAARLPAPEAEIRFHPTRKWRLDLGWRDRLADADSGDGHWGREPLEVGRNAIEGEVTRRGRKQRALWRVKPGLQLLAYGIPGRMGRLRGFGNAVVPQVAQVFIEAYLDSVGQR